MSANHAHQPAGDHASPVQRARGAVRLAGHVPAMLASFWSSELNRETVGLLAPQPGEVVLDIGAGMGAGALVAAARVCPGGAVIAVDPSRMMRATMRARGLGPGAAQLDVRAGAAESLPVTPATVDAAYAVNATHHFADLPRFAAEIALALRPGGRLLLVEEDMSRPDHPFSSLHAATAGDGGHGHRPHEVDGEALVTLLVSAGLESADSVYQTVGGTPCTVISALRAS